MKSVALKAVFGYEGRGRKEVIQWIIRRNLVGAEGDRTDFTRKMQTNSKKKTTEHQNPSFHHSKSTNLSFHPYHPPLPSWGSQASGTEGPGPGGEPLEREEE